MFLIACVTVLYFVGLKDLTKFCHEMHINVNVPMVVYGSMFMAWSACLRVTMIPVKREQSGCMGLDSMDPVWPMPSGLRGCAVRLLDNVGLAVILAGVLWYWVF